MMFVLHFYAISNENSGTGHDKHFSDPYRFRLSYQTYHFEIVSFSTLERAYSLTRTILYNRMIFKGSYHKFFTFTEQSHLLWDILSLDILTTHGSCASVNDFRINITYY